MPSSRKTQFRSATSPSRASFWQTTNPWLILVPRLPGLVELIDLEDNAQVQLLGEIAAVADALKTVTRCDKLNIAALGNQVPQLHVHIIARRHTDAAWPKPVWGMKPPISYERGQQTILIDALRQCSNPAVSSRWRTVSEDSKIHDD